MVSLKAYEKDRGRKLKSVFLSDFNFKGERRNDHCYMHGQTIPVH